MNTRSKKTIRRVLKEAAEHERFFDFSDGERLTWMIQRAYELGRLAAPRLTTGSKQMRPQKCLLKAQTSR